MRYLWELYPAYRNEWTRSKLKRAFMTPLAHYLRLWDFASAARVDQFIANSENVQRRIEKTYRRDATVIYPPVSVDTFYEKPAEDYYFIASELVAYKRIDQAVRVFAKSGRKLKIAGDGPEFASLKRLASKNIELCGHVSDVDLRELYARSRAVLMPGEEDFGITAVEALASGKPVIALGRGGALETVPCFGGIHYSYATDDCLADAIRRSDSLQTDPRALQAWAGRFSESEFAAKMSRMLASGRHHPNPSPSAQKYSAPAPDTSPDDLSHRPTESDSIYPPARDPVNRIPSSRTPPHPFAPRREEPSMADSPRTNHAPAPSR
jgi:glycosyltransferase involved in cell wall biosynthesis